MVNHIVMWRFKDEVSLEDRKKLSIQIKEGLEGLKNKISGIIDIQVIINKQDSSNRDLGMISSFESIEALNVYQKSEEHLIVASIVREATCDRACLDYEI